MSNEYSATAYAAHIGSQDDSRWVTQTKFYDPTQPPEVCTGNCTEAALASLFGIGLDEVPSMQGLASGDYWEALEAFVRSRGYVLSMPPPSHHPAGLYLADGPSERGCGHFVVMRDGKMVHDPHPSRAGLLNVERVWSLVALDPAAISAQPSPAGQDGQRVTVRVAGVGQCTLTVNDGSVEIPAETIAALAARKPVCETDAYQQGFRDGQDRTCTVVARQQAGEPVAQVPVHPRSGPLWSETLPTGSELHRSYSYPMLALYVAPAQAVDLAQFRPAVLSYWSECKRQQTCATGGPLANQNAALEQVRHAESLLALIDGKAVGK